MNVFEDRDLNSLYIKLIHALNESGVEISKEGRKIKELAPCILKITSPKAGILVVEGRPYSPAFVVAETLWNLTGDSTDWLCDYNKVYEKYFTDKQLKAGYGNRIFNWGNDSNQFDLVAQRLEAEPFSEHASITIFNPTYDLKNPVFVPCITKLKFRIRNNKLHMTSFMRAQDIWLGFPYDINLLLTLFQLMSIRLNIEMGEYYHYCDVLRLYEVDYETSQYVRNTVELCDNNIELEGICDFGKFALYRSILKEMPLNSLELIKTEPEYWQNAIKCCIAYNHLHSGDVLKTREIVGSITNCFRQQFKIWAKHYHPIF